MAAVMAESGRTPAPRTVRHGYSRAPLSAAWRPLDSRGQTRLPILRDPAAPASPRAALHLAHSSNRPRSDPDHAAARHARGSEGLCAAPRWLDRRASWPFAEGRTVSFRHSGAIARCSAPDRASLRRTRHGVDRDPRQRREDFVRGRRAGAYGSSRARLPQARGAQGFAQGFAGLRGGTRCAGPAGLDPRSVEPLGFVHHGRIAVVLMAADPGAALRARLSRRARSGASGRDETLSQVLA